ncbi:MAG: hypothetical protein J6Y64_09970 [Ruminococcus sp.]|nr:hypothetical protein [Ruminococcus sp.]
MLYYTRNEIIRFLEERNFECFELSEALAEIATTEQYCIAIEAKDHVASEEYVNLALSVLRDLDKHIGRAQNWLGNFNVKHDRWHPEGLDAGFELRSIYIGKYETGGERRFTYEGFMMTFGTVNYYPCEFVVKFNMSMTPFAVEEIVE